jgi:aminoglycoside phosphotransferase (APT) family kinase protein
VINLNPEDAALSAHVISIAEHLYGERPQIRKFHSQVSYVCALTFDTLPAKVIKLERNVPGLIALEVRRLRALQALGLPVPFVEITSDALSNPSVPFYITPLIATLRLGDLVWAKRAAAVPACYQAGAFVRRLHQYTDQNLPADLINREPLRAFTALMPHLPSDARTKFDLLLDAIHKLSAATPHALCHGQLHTENVVADDSGAFGVVDWETLGVGSLWADVALFLRTVQEWNNGSDAHCQAFWDGLGAHAADYQREIAIWSLFEAANNFDWQLAEGFVVEPAKLRDLSNSLAAFD